MIKLGKRGAEVRRFIILCLLFIVSGCTRELEPSAYGDVIKETDPLVTLEIEIDTRTVPDEIPYLIKNQSDHSLTEGREFAIEKYDDKQEKWFQIPFREGSAHQLDAWIIEPDSQSRESVNIDVLDQSLTDGVYRLIKVLSSDGNGIVVYGKFTVENDKISKGAEQ